MHSGAEWVRLDQKGCAMHIGCTFGSVYSWLPAHLGWDHTPLCPALCSLQPALARQRPTAFVHLHPAGCRAAGAHAICGFEWTCCTAARCCPPVPSKMGGASSGATDRQGKASTEPVVIRLLTSEGLRKAAQRDVRTPEAPVAFTLPAAAAILLALFWSWLLHDLPFWELAKAAGGCWGSRGFVGCPGRKKP